MELRFEVTFPYLWLDSKGQAIYQTDRCAGWPRFGCATSTACMDLLNFDKTHPRTPILMSFPTLPLPHCMRSIAGFLSFTLPLPLKHVHPQ